MPEQICLGYGDIFFEEKKIRAGIIGDAMCATNFFIKKKNVKLIKILKEFIYKRMSNSAASIFICCSIKNTERDRPSFIKTGEISIDLLGDIFSPEHNKHWCYLLTR